MNEIKKTVLVTGACKNTGVAIVEKFAQKGRDIVFTGRNENEVRGAERIYNEKFPNVKITGYTINSLTDENTVDEQAVYDMFEYLDRHNIFIETVILNAADQGLGITAFENPISDFVRVINTNMVWNYCISTEAAKRMKEKGGGNIIFINSNTAYRAIPDRIAYSASKGGQLGMMRAMARDFGKYNIRVNAILPGMIKTDRWEKNPEFYKNVPSKYTPLGDVAVGEDVADAAWYFAAHGRNTTGAELVVDGGNTIQLYPIIPPQNQ
ncbi:MAG: SDR family NAD(P)-dependent oxidoreductase [Clostridiales bacterium]|nr:SDR family NAD(P)-dependent oxidoreductase [Clostridiales bacterium]